MSIKKNTDRIYKTLSDTASHLLLLCGSPASVVVGGHRYSIQTLNTGILAVHLLCSSCKFEPRVQLGLPPLPPSLQQDVVVERRHWGQLHDVISSRR